MAIPRPFRFGTGVYQAATGAELTEKARRVEALGYDTLVIPDHFSRIFAPIATLTAAAMATSTLRVCPLVFDNDFRHPVVLAKEMATLDVLSDGRLEMGIGAGWLKDEYDQAGIRFDPAATRVERMMESVAVMKGLWGEGACSFAGDHYRVDGLEGWPKPIQQPHPPLFIGAGGRRLLAFAAREADIIGVIAQATPGGQLDTGADTEALLAEKVAWVREAAGERFEQLELSALIWGVAVGTHPEDAAAEIARTRGMPVDEVLASPYFLIGSVEGIVERVQELRERFGLSYFTIFPRDMEAFAPVVARLAGT